MFGNMVSWRDYEGLDGIGNMLPSSAEEVANLNKALSVGQEINKPSVAAGEGFAFRVESLERSLKVTTYRNEHVRFWRAIPKRPARNTVEEHNEMSSYAENEDTGWIQEIDLPEDDSSTYERKYAVVKFLGTTRSVSHVSTVIDSAIGNVIAQETISGTMKLLRILERALFYGDSSLSSLQFDGYEKLISDNAPATNVIDLRGQPLSEDILNDGAMTVFDAPNYGQATHLYLNPRVKSDLCKAFFPKERYDLFSKTSKGMVGLDIRGFTSGAGDVLFEPDVFINDGGAAPAAAVGDAAKRPGTPTISTAPTTPVEATAQFGADDAGDYFYKVVACNRYGKSVAVDLVAGPTAVTVAAGDKVTWGVTPGGSTTVEWYEVYRTKVGGNAGTERQILRIPNTAGAGEETLNDLNASLPYTSSAFLLQMNTESLSVKQLAPMIKIPLATISTAIRWMQLIYLVPVLYAPKKNVLFKNIGRAAGSVGNEM